MYTSRFFRKSFVSAVALATLILFAVSMIPGPARAASDVKIEWLTWGFYRITSPSGKVIMINPWYKNPDGIFTLDDIPKGDIILLTSGHGDEVGNALEIGAKTGATIVATHEVVIGKLKKQGEGFGDPIKFNGAEFPAKMVQPSSRFTIDGITIRVVSAEHGGGDAGGTALGFFVTMENGFTVFYSGGTDLTADMKLWGELFQPDAVILYYPPDAEPRTVALTAKYLSEANPGLKTVMLQHQRVKQQDGKATPADLASEMTKLGLTAELINPKPGTVYSLTK